MNYWLRTKLLKGMRGPNGYWLINRSDLNMFLTRYNGTERKLHVVYMGGSLDPDTSNRINSTIDCLFTHINSPDDFNNSVFPDATLLLVEKEHLRSREFVTFVRSIKGMRYTPITLLCQAQMDEDWLEFATRSNISSVIYFSTSDIRVEIERHLLQKNFPAFRRTVN